MEMAKLPYGVIEKAAMIINNKVIEILKDRGIKIFSEVLQKERVFPMDMLDEDILELTLPITIPGSDVKRWLGDSFTGLPTRYGIRIDNTEKQENELTLKVYPKVGK